MGRGTRSTPTDAPLRGDTPVDYKLTKPRLKALHEIIEAGYISETGGSRGGWIGGAAQYAIGNRRFDRTMIHGVLAAGLLRREDANGFTTMHPTDAGRDAVKDFEPAAKPEPVAPAPRTIDDDLASLLWALTNGLITHADDMSDRARELAAEAQRRGWLTAELAVTPAGRAAVNMP